MNIADRIKHAPKWVWFTVAGVTVGVIAIRVFQGRDAPPTDQVATDQTTGAVPGSQAPSPVIVPPVIQQTDGGGDNSAGIIGAVGGVFTPIIDDLTGLIGGAIPGQQQTISDLIGLVGQQTDAVIAAQMSAGDSPAAGAAHATPILAAPVKPSTQQTKPCCTYHGHPLSWWQKPGNARCKNGKWNHPGPGGCSHPSAFRGHQACDGGGSSGVSHREC